jgi:predicted nucleotidyltransferase
MRSGTNGSGKRGICRFYFVFALLGLRIRAEEITADGRIDAVIETADMLFLFGFELFDTAENALAQIGDREYFLKYRDCGKKIVLVGVSFDAETRNIGRWVRVSTGHGGETQSPETRESMAFDTIAAAQNLKRRFEAQRQQRLALHARAVKECDTIVQMIKTDFNPRSMYLWGSLLHPEQFDENSDIDIAVEGLDSASALFALTGKALDMTNQPLDIVELEHVGPPDRESILSKGRLVHERSQSV